MDPSLPPSSPEFSPPPENLRPPPSEPLATPPAESAPTMPAEAAPFPSPASDSPAAVQTPAPEPVPPPLPPAPQPVPFVFHGQAREFFQIWIVNTLLTLVTLGIFFAWAKVRKRRYLRGCTELMGQRFDYRANPRRLLIGNLIVFIFFLGYSLFGVVYPPIRYGVLGVGLIMLPWVVVRSMTFNAHNTVYRGMRFRFHTSLAGAVGIFLLRPLVIVISLGFYYPAWARARREYLVTSHRLGDAYFRFTPPTSAYYSAYVLGALMVFGASAIGGLYLGGVMALTGARQPGFAMMIPFFICYGIGLFTSKHFIHASLFNRVWNETRLDDHRFIATMSVSRWLGLQFTNLGAILISGGLLYPWAVIRAHTYTASCLQFLPAGNLEAIERLGGAKGSAVGDTAAEFIGLDFGL